MTTVRYLKGFYILADLNWEQQDPAADPEHCILLCVKSFKDGTVQLHPPVEASGTMADPASKAGSWPYKVHDRRGGVYEYRVYVQTSQTPRDSVMERRDLLWSEQERAHAAQAQRTMLGRFLHFNGSCVCIRGDILSAGGFERSSLYVEFSLRFPKELWTLKGPKWLVAKTEEADEVFADKDVAHVRTPANLNWMHAGCHASQRHHQRFAPTKPCSGLNPAITDLSNGWLHKGAVHQVVVVARGLLWDVGYQVTEEARQSGSAHSFDAKQQYQLKLQCARVTFLFTSMHVCRWRGARRSAGGRGSQGGSPPARPAKGSRISPILSSFFWS